jgi:dimethylglycine dehydrogenase
MTGAEIVLHNRVLELNPRDDGTWDVGHRAGHDPRRHVVNAAGLWAREVFAMAASTRPSCPWRTSTSSPTTSRDRGLPRPGKEFPHVMDPGGESYLRQEGRGICIGFYEKPCEPWSWTAPPGSSATSF